MSTITTCHGFVSNSVSNTWRKDVCSNCFRLRDEHPMKISVNSRFATNKFNSSSSANKTNMNNSRYYAESGFHPSNSGDNTLPRINGGGTSGSGKSVNVTQSHFGAGSSTLTTSHYNYSQKQKNKSSLQYAGGSGSRSQSSVSFTSGGQSKGDKSSRNSIGMDSGEISGSRKPQFSVGGPMRGTPAQRGILKSKDGSKTSRNSGGRRGVSFPAEVFITLR